MRTNNSDKFKNNGLYPKLSPGGIGINTFLNGEIAIETYSLKSGQTSSRERTSHII